MPLPLATRGAPQVIRKISGEPLMRKHLASLGFVEGGTVTVLSSLQSGLIVKVKESRVAMGFSLARHVAV